MRIDQVMIKGSLGYHELGVYSAAVKLYESWILLPAVIMMSLLPLVLRVKQKSIAEYHDLLIVFYRVAFWGSAVVAFISTIYADEIILYIFGYEYAAAGTVLGVVMWAALFSTMNSVSARYFNAENMERKIVTRTFIAAGLNVLLNMLLIPLWGISGAAVSTLLCVVLSSYVMDWFDRDLRCLLKIKHRAIFFSR
jgi:O-antigen/teichoic acid export membrane protein